MGSFPNAKDWIGSARLGKALEAVCPRQVRVQARARSADGLDLGKEARGNSEVPPEKGISRRHIWEEAGMYLRMPSASSKCGYIIFI